MLFLALYVGKRIFLSRKFCALIKSAFALIQEEDILLSQSSQFVFFLSIKASTFQLEFGCVYAFLVTRGKHCPSRPYEAMRL